MQHLMLHLDEVRECVKVFKNLLLWAFTLQVYFYSFDVFRAAGIQQQQLRYAALGTGLCELATSVTCVSLIFSVFLVH